MYEILTEDERTEILSDIGRSRAVKGIISHDQFTILRLNTAVVAFEAEVAVAHERIAELEAENATLQAQVAGLGAEIAVLKKPYLRCGECINHNSEANWCNLYGGPVTADRLVIPAANDIVCDDWEKRAPRRAFWGRREEAPDA